MHRAFRGNKVFRRNRKCNFLENNCSHTSQLIKSLSQYSSIVKVCSCHFSTIFIAYFRSSVGHYHFNEAIVNVLLTKLIFNTGA
jgi:hypothetical protein